MNWPCSMALPHLQPRYLQLALSRICGQRVSGFSECFAKYGVNDLQSASRLQETPARLGETASRCREMTTWVGAESRRFRAEHAPVGADGSRFCAVVAPGREISSRFYANMGPACAANIAGRARFACPSEPNPRR
jgi:hypothetical protein